MPENPVYEVVSCGPAETVVESLRESDSDWFGAFTYAEGDVAIEVRAANEDARKLMWSESEYWYFRSGCDGIQPGARIEDPVLAVTCCDLGPVSSLPCGVGGTELLTLVPRAAAPGNPPPVTYGDQFSDRYSSASDQPENIPADFPVERRVVVHSPSKNGVAITDRTNGAVVPYEESIAVVTVRHPFGEPVYLKSTGFRTIEVTWIGERYVRLNKGIGHVVGIEEIYDLVDRSWLVQHTVSYRLP